MPTYKVTYFPVKALAEPMRFLLSYMGEQFEDYRFPREEWPNIKPNMPFGKVPVLEIDGKMLHQSTAISRYLGKQAKLAGKDDWESLQIDIAVDTVHDFRALVASYWYESDEAVKARKRDEAQPQAKTYLDGLEKLVNENNGHLANSALSWGDLYFVAISDYLIKMLGWDYFEKYENLRKLRDNVLAIPNIKKWVETRPESEV